MDMKLFVTHGRRGEHERRESMAMENEKEDFVYGKTVSRKWRSLQEKEDRGLRERRFRMTSIEIQRLNRVDSG
jgi:hypothetical protein